MKPLTFATAALALLAALPATAQFRNAEAATKYRQAVMTLQNYHAGRIFSMANGRIPFDAKVVADDAAVLEAIDRLAFVAYIDGSDQGNTRAKPEVWTERAKFNAAAQKMQDEVSKLVAAAKTGSLDQIKPAVGAVSKSCDDCHDGFRKK